MTFGKVAAERAGSRQGLDDALTSGVQSEATFLAEFRRAFPLPALESVAMSSFRLLVTCLCLATPLGAQVKSTPAAAPKAAPALRLKTSVERPDALYRRGEKAVFLLEATLGDQPAGDLTVTCVLSKDGVAPQPPVEVRLKAGKGRLEGGLEEPGFLLLRASSGKVSALASAGFDPQDIRPSLPVPEDFDAFWSAQKAVLATVEPAAELVPVAAPASVKGVECFDLKVACMGAPVSGYFSRPTGARPGSLPAILTVHGAGVRSSSLGGSASWAAREGGMLALDINAHGLPNGRPDAYYEAQAAGPLKDYRYSGRTERQQNYFTGMFLRLIRAIDYLTAQPEWDGRTLVVYGSSQGGFQALAAAGLDARVTFICAGVPAGCDHSGAAVGRVNGWPKLVPTGADGKPDPAAQQTARYVDAMNFATRARCAGAAVTVGYIDTTCPPTSVLAAYNALPVPKRLHADVLSGHTSTPAGSHFLQEAAIEHIRSLRR